MNTKEDIRPISYIKTNAANVLARVNETHRPVIITQNGEAKAVLLDTESYDSMQNALGILKLVSMGEKDLHEGRVAEQNEFFSVIEKRLSKKR
jgi:prevent-host-death family protein